MSGLHSGEVNLLCMFNHITIKRNSKHYLKINYLGYKEKEH